MKLYERKMDSRQQSDENNKISLMSTYQLDTALESGCTFMFAGIRPNIIDRHKHLWTYFLYPIQIMNVKASSGFILRSSCLIAVGCGHELSNVDRMARFVFGCFF